MAEASTLRRRLQFAVPIAFAALFILGGWTLRNKLAADRQGEWVRATRGDLITGFEVSGTLSAIESVTIGAPRVEDMWQFKLAMLAPEGTDVKKGQPIVAFDTTELQRRLEEKSAEAEEARKQIEKERADLTLRSRDERLALAEAEARLRKSELKMEAPPDVAGVNESKQAAIDYAIAAREAVAIRNRIEAIERAAKARIALLESRQREAETVVAQTTTAIREMRVVSPRDGTVVYVTNWRGDKKKVGDSVHRMESVLEIPDLSRMQAEGEVDEADAGRVAVGQRVTLRLDAHPDEEFGGTITSAGRTVQQKRGTQDPVKVLRVMIRLDRTDAARMRPGMRFQGTIELARARNVVLIPREAVRMASTGAYVQRRGRFDVDAVPIRIGRENEKSVEVVKGIAPGDRVLVEKIGDAQEKE